MIINVAYSSSDLYSKFAGISMISLFENNKNLENINIYFIEDHVSNDNKNKLLKIANTYNRKLIFIPFDSISTELKQQSNNFARSTYGKLFLYKLEGIDKIIYIDCDTVIYGSLIELWITNLENYVLGGVLDCVYPYEKKVISMSIDDNYFNCGVLLLNLEAWRKNKITETCIKYLDDNNYKTPNFDQGLINCICHDKALVIDPKFNMMSHVFSYKTKEVVKLFNIKFYYTDDILQNAKNNPIIIHYLEHFYGKPWYKDSSHPYKNIFLNYWNKSPWSINLDIKKTKKRLKIRKFICKRLKFTIYYYLENLLNIRRSKITRKEFQK